MSIFGNNDALIPPSSSGSGTASVWFNGSGTPSDGLGVDGDYYLNDVNGDVYNKVGGTWVLVANIQGATGTGGALGNYGAFQDNTTQSVGSTTQAYPIRIGMTDSANGVSIATHDATFIGSRSGSTLDVTSISLGAIKLGMTIVDGAGWTTAVVTGTISGNTLTVTAVTSGSLTIGTYITGGAISNNTQITAFVSGSGGVGTYTINNSQTISSPITINGFNILITAFVSGSGGIGTYTTSTSGAIGSTSLTGRVASKILFANSGVYNIQFSAQFQNTLAQLQDTRVWIRLNGTDVTGSGGLVSVSNTHGAGDGNVITSWNYVLPLNANDYVEFYWSSTSTSVTMPYLPISSSPTSPSCASFIVTATQVMYTQIGSQWYNGTGVPSNSLGVDNDYYLDNATSNVYFKASGTWSIVTNIKGGTGSTGATGNDGANTRRWIFELANQATGPSSTKFKTNSATLSAITSFTINYFDAYSIDESNWMTTAANLFNAGKPIVLQITEVASSNVIASYNVSAIASAGSYYGFGISSLISGSGTLVIGNTYSISYVAGGSNGTNGTNGSTVLNGAGAPSAGAGSNGDYYINDTNGDFYEKSGGSWAIIVSLAIRNSPAFTGTPTAVTQSAGNNSTTLATTAYIDGSRGASFYGSGSDGNVTISGNTTLTRNMYYNTLTINAGITLSTADFMIFAKTSITNNGTISGRINGANGGNATGVTQGTGATYSASTSPVIGFGQSGANGAGGGSGVGSQGSAITGQNIFGGSGAAGGAGGSGGAGAGGIASIVQTANFYPLQTIVTLFTGSINLGQAGAGGSSGAGNGVGNNGGAGGGGGTSGGAVYLASPTITNNNIVTVQGFNGGNGGNATGAGNCGGGGGGGAGGGGFIYMLYNTITLGTCTISGGTGGTGGAKLGTGLIGSNGSNGSVGKLIRINLTTQITTIT